jgi:hypothetical protein
MDDSHLDYIKNFLKKHLWIWKPFWEVKDVWGGGGGGGKRELPYPKVSFVIK